MENVKVYTDGFETLSRGRWIERTMDEDAELDTETAASIVDQAIAIGDLEFVGVYHY